MTPPTSHFGPVPHDRPDAAGDRAGTTRLLAMLAEVADQAAVVALAGRAAYLADSPDGVVRRLAGQAVLIRVATIVERLPEAYTTSRPEVPWREITAMRNLAAHRCERIDDVIVWRTLVADVPDLLRALGVSPHS